MRAFLFILVCISLVLCSCDITTNSYPDPRVKTIPVLEAYTTEENYQVLFGSRDFNLPVPLQIFYGNSRVTGQIRAQGRGSRYKPKWSFEVLCDDGMAVEGLNNFNISAQVYDKSMVKTALVSAVYRAAGFPTFQSTHAFLKMNSADRGLYVLTERVDSNFFLQRNIPIAELVQVIYGAKFSLAETGDIRRNFEKNIPDDKNFGNFSELLHALDIAEPAKMFETVGKLLDIRNYLRYHALTTVVNNTDAFSNNFYLYKTAPATPYKILPWDFDNAFNSANDAGFSGKNEIIRALLKNDSCFSIYKAELQSALMTQFTESKLFPMIDSVATRIRSAYNLDPYLGQAGISLDQECATLRAFITNRRTYLLSNLGNYSR